MEVTSIAIVVFAALFYLSAETYGQKLFFRDAQSTLSNDLETFFRILKTPRVPERYLKQRFHDGTPKVTRFSLQNCGPSTDTVILNSVTITPDPVHIPGTITGGFDVVFKSAITAPLACELTLKKKIGIAWLEIPCLDNVGSCTYKDLCSMIPLAPSSPCPPPLGLYNIPCTCPFKAGHYVLPPSQFFIPATGAPSFLVDGDFSVKARLTIKGQEVGCVSGYVSITT